MICRDKKKICAVYSVLLYTGKANNFKGKKMNLPTIRLEIEGMRHTVLRAISERNGEMEAYIKQTLEKMCKEESIKDIVETEARTQIQLALKEEVKNFFTWSSSTGRQAIREAVLEHLERMFDLRRK